MRIGVCGLGHLGTVTAACLAEHYDVVCYDPNYDSTIHPFCDDRDPSVSHLFEVGLKNKAIRIVPSVETFLGAGATLDPATRATTYNTAPELVLVCFDAHSAEDYERNLERMDRVLPFVPADTPVIISSPLKVGTMAKLAARYTMLKFVYQPENLRMGRGIICFKQPDRIVLGISSANQREFLTKLFKPFTTGSNGDNLLFMSCESAEMVKHGLNTFLATTIAFANEFGAFCIKNGANPKDVERGLKSDSRIGTRAYLAYGDPPGQHLSRDVDLLADLCGGLFSAIKASNESFGGR